jgi:hypothetical protein
MLHTSATEELNGQLGSVAGLSPQKGPLASYEQDRSRERKENQM